MVRDDVRYALPGPWFVTRAVNRFFVAPDITRIFEFRHARLIAIFNARTSSRVGPVTIRSERT
jgi:hypothetical protein